MSVETNDISTTDRDEIAQKRDYYGDDDGGVFGARSITTLVGLLLFALAGYVYFAGTLSLNGILAFRINRPQHDFSKLYRSLEIAPLPTLVENSDGVFEGLSRLANERCDKEAVYSLASSLDDIGQKRSSAEVLEGFGAKCDDHEGEYRIAADHYLSIEDYPKALRLAERLVEMRPEIGLYWYYKGRAEVGQEDFAKALASYATSIRITPNQKDIGVWVFTEMAKAYSEAGRNCEAVSPLETYISLSPGENDTAAIRSLIDKYGSLGGCANFVAGDDHFTVLTNDVISARVSINGTYGTFAVDTGASFVTLTSAFAKKAKIVVSEEKVRVDSANGAMTARLAKADTIKVGRVSAASVPVLVQTTTLGTLDGLLGRSFLSRFDMTIAGNQWSLRSRKIAEKSDGWSTAKESHANSTDNSLARTPRDESNSLDAQFVAKGECDDFLIRANAIFIRATTFCQKNYMDSSAGYAALAATRRCVSSGGRSIGSVEKNVKAAMLSVDEAVRRKGRNQACTMVEETARQVVRLSSKTKIKPELAPADRLKEMLRLENNRGANGYFFGGHPELERPYLTQDFLRDFNSTRNDYNGPEFDGSALTFAMNEESWRIISIETDFLTADDASVRVLLDGKAADGPKRNLPRKLIYRFKLESGEWRLDDIIHAKTRYWPQGSERQFLAQMRTQDPHRYDPSPEFRKSPAVQPIPPKLEAQTVASYPLLKPGQTYRELRTILLSSGWRPFRDKVDPNACDIGDPRCEHYPEVEACAGSREANCKFVWVARNGKTFAVNTIGEVVPTVDSFNYNHTAE